MFTYTNTSHAVKTFYGVVFKPGDSKEVSGFINDSTMIRVPNVPEKPTKADVKKSPQPTKQQAAQQVKDAQPNKSEKQGGESDGSDNNK